MPSKIIPVREYTVRAHKREIHTRRRKPEVKRACERNVGLPAVGCSALFCRGW
ncbi:MAG: hypothetical protein KME55_33155 [Nostoc indistinguendum CM1-VF10]|nr:hypothetical protein [Nostoc indistinguendum CM1-VF10]